MSDIDRLQCIDICKNCTIHRIVQRMKYDKEHCMKETNEILPIRLARENDIPAVTAIYDKVLREEEQGRYTIGWIRGIYPTEETAGTAIAAGELFVLETEGKVIASARINHEQMPAYARVSWSVDAAQDQVMVMHTLTVDPEMNGCGAGKRFLQFYEEYALKHGSHILRIDTNERNLNARRMYAAAGYEEKGIIPCEFNGIPDVGLVCMEKVHLP